LAPYLGHLPLKIRIRMASVQFILNVFRENGLSQEKVYRYAKKFEILETGMLNTNEFVNETL
jgi:hypothetical protein